MIKLHNLNKIYPGKSDDIFALKNINLQVAPGEIVGVIGKSGAGKSTLIRCVNLLERPTSGSVCVNNVELTTLNPFQLRQARHQIGMIFQHFNLLATRNVYHNVSFPLQLLKKYRAKEVLIRLGYVIGGDQPLIKQAIIDGKETSFNYDCRPAAIIERLNLKQPIYLQTAQKGHFGYINEYPWEKI